MIPITYHTDGLVPVITQDHTSREVLMFAYADAEAVCLTRETGFAHYYSRSRKKIWKKGEESGHVQQVHEIRIDCDGDALLYLVSQQTAACHTGHRSCFYRTLDGKILTERLFEPDKVYTNSNE